MHLVGWKLCSVALYSDSMCICTHRLDLVLWFSNAGLRFVAGSVISENVRIRVCDVFLSRAGEGEKGAADLLGVGWENFECRVTRRLTTGIRSDKCVVGRLRLCANVIECTYTNLDSIAYYTPRLYGIV